MSRLQSILAATDFSPLGNNAVRRAAFLAAEHGAVLHILHVASNKCPEPALESARVQLRWLARQIGSREDLVVRTELVSGSIVEHLVTQAGHHDLLVVGQRSHWRFKDMVRSRISEQVVRASVGPVLAVRLTAARPYRRITIATNFSQGCEAAARLAADLSPRAQLQLAHALRFSGQDSAMREVGVPLHIVQAYRHREVLGTQARLRRLAQRVGIARDRVEHAVTRGPAAPMTLRLLQAWRTDLLVAGHSGSNAVCRFLVGDIPREFLRDAQADVLVVPSKQSSAFAAELTNAAPEPGR